MLPRQSTKAYLASFMTLLIMGLGICFTNTITPAHSADTKAYKIKLDRPIKVGQTFRIKASGYEAKSAAARVGNKSKELPGETTSFSLVADYVIMEISDTGDATKIRIVIDTLNEQGTGVDKALLPRGVVVIGEVKNGKETYELTKGKLSKAAHNAIEKTFSLDTDDGPSDDKIFDTQKPRKVGDSWPINKKQAALSFNKMKLKADIKNLTGTTKFVQIRDIEGQKCIDLSHDIKITKFTPSIAQKLPPGTTLKNSLILFSGHNVVPVNTDSLLLYSTMNMKMAVVMSAPGPVPGQKVEIHTTVTGVYNKTIHQMN
jgi:hypothetical protein